MVGLVGGGGGGGGGEKKGEEEEVRRRGSMYWSFLSLSLVPSTQTK